MLHCRCRFVPMWSWVFVGRINAFLLVDGNPLAFFDLWEIRSYTSISGSAICEFQDAQSKVKELDSALCAVIWSASSETTVRICVPLEYRGYIPANDFAWLDVQVKWETCSTSAIGDCESNKRCTAHFTRKWQNKKTRWRLGRVSVFNRLGHLSKQELAT